MRNSQPLAVNVVSRFRQFVETERLEMEPCVLIHTGQAPLWELVFERFHGGYALGVPITCQARDRDDPGADSQVISLPCLVPFSQALSMRGCYDGH